MTPEGRDHLCRGAAALTLILLVLGTALPAPGAPPPSGESTASSEDRSSRGEDPLTLKQAGREFLSDTGRIWSSPTRIKTKTMVPLIALAAATTFLIAADEPIRDGVQTFAEKHAWVGDVGPVITEMGGIGAFATAGAFFGAGLIFKDARARETGFLAANAILQSFLVDSFLKGMTGRQRPFIAAGEDHWSGPVGFFRRFEKSQKGLYDSFPSGHSAAAFSLATVVALQYRHHAWVPVVAYTLASGVGLSRMTLDRHWASDVAIGALIGYGVGRLVVRNHGRRQRVVPMLACTARGVALSVSLDLDPAGR